MARVAVEMLIGANRGDVLPPTEQSLHRVLTHELVVRGSTSAPAQPKRKR
jgi:DNA-binding LacI/PurR family transcriptional regulator